MLTVLRKIRKSLISKNLISKYLVYAIGEIALVVIGILIALQINNWNSFKKEQEEEKFILYSMRRDLSRDTIQLQTLIRNAREQLQVIDSIYLDMYRPERVTGGTFLNRTYSMASSEMFEVNSVTFQESVSTGTLKYIQNDSIRQEIFEYYRDAIENRTDKFINDLRLQIIWPIAFKKLSPNKEFMEDIDKPTNLPGLDVQALSRDPEFISMVNNSFTNVHEKISGWEEFLTTAKNLVNKIDDELR